MSVAEPATARLDLAATEVGSVFVSNYPPYSVWSEEHVPAALAALERPPSADASLGLYVHIPFCRRRCKFCYFRVFTEKNSSDIRRYIDAVAREVEAYAGKTAITGRPLKFVYFGGGTPSYLSADQLTELVGRLKAALPWENAEEVAFECEPGTLTRPKLEAIRDLGVTRLSLGIESFDDQILELNGRAHVSTEIYRVRPWIEELDFEQLNIDLIAGMVGETWDSWRDSVRRAIEYAPDSVTIYQLELPFNTVFSKGVLEQESEYTFASWAQKREWHAWAVEQLEEAGFESWSAYVMLKKGDKDTRFVYADSLWHGSDMIGAGVSSFSHVDGVHFQNADRWDDYLARVENGELPIRRAYPPTPEEAMTRELVLQLKTGLVRPSYFEEKFGVDVEEHFAAALGTLRSQGMLTVASDEVRVTREGILRIDQLLPEFYAEKYRATRYT